MRLVELFINEKISLTHLKQPLLREIEDSLIYCINQVYYHKDEVSEEILKYAEAGKFGKLQSQVEYWLAKTIVSILPSGIEQILLTATSIPVQVKFEKIGARGVTSGLSITLNVDIALQLAHDIAGHMMNVALRDAQNIESIIEYMFGLYRDADESILEMIDEYEVNKLIVLLIHEMVHVYQHNSQYKVGRDRTEYRSYLVKDPEEFRQSVSRLSKTDTPDYNGQDFNAYMASPQEIPAFAHEAAMMFIDDMKVDEVDNLIKFRNTVPSLIKDYIDNRFNNPKNPKEYTVFKKFHKLMYQEIIRYIERAHKQRKRATRRNKATV